jgi:hypothetical protein
MENFLIAIKFYAETEVNTQQTNKKHIHSYLRLDRKGDFH